MIRVTCRCGHVINSRNPITIPCPVCRALVHISTGGGSAPIDVWGMLHRYAIENKNNWDPHRAFMWFSNTWQPLVPSHLPSGAECGCSTHWSELTSTTEFKPDFSSPDVFEHWAWRAHNAVSERHSGARIIGFEQSCKLWRSPRVGFWTTAYMPIGGTETWHRTLLPELRHRVRVAGLWAFNCQGDSSLLQVPYWTDPTEMAKNIDVLVTWGVDSIAEHLGPNRPYVISVHHSDCNSPWSDKLQFQPQIDRVVAISPDVPGHLVARGLTVPVTYIPNPVNKPLYQWKPETPKTVLWPHRDSVEKQPNLARKVAELLPDGWRMIMTTDGTDTQKIQYIGKITSSEEMAKHTSRASVLLSLSTFEGFGYSVAEALISGVPVVTYARGVANTTNSTIIPENAEALEIAALCVNAPTRPPLALTEHDTGAVADAWEYLILGAGPRANGLAVS